MAIPNDKNPAVTTTAIDYPHVLTELDSMGVTTDNLVNLTTQGAAIDDAILGTEIDTINAILAYLRASKNIAE